MAMKIGCDLVNISNFAERVRTGGEDFLARVFLPDESEGASLERLAGIFAAKEAACKALSIPAGNWRMITVLHELSGAPRLEISYPGAEEAETSLSISHDGDYAMAVVIHT